MKKLLLGLIFTTMTASAMAGVIQNKKTAETIELILDRTSRQVEVYSLAKNLENLPIELVSIDQKKSNIRLFGGTHHFFTEMIGGEEMFVFFLPPAIIGPIVYATYDILAMPIKAPLKIMKNLKYKKDYKIIMKAVFSTDYKMVSDKRFRRIEATLKASQKGLK